MGTSAGGLSGPDYEAGVELVSLPEGRPVLGHAMGEPVVLVREGDEVFALGAACPHYGTSLAEGLVVDGTLRCPAHHACFSLRTGDALRAPALNPVAAFAVEQREGRVRVTGRLPAPRPRNVVRAGPSSVVIVGAGAAGSAAAELLRREGYRGPITLLGRDPSPPYDRPNLSKDYLAGTAPEEWIPLRSAEFYAEKDLLLRTGVEVARIDPAEHRVVTVAGEELTYGALLLAPGAEPLVPAIPGTALPQVFTLRTLEDSRRIIAAAGSAHRAVVLGAGFIGLEVAASLRARQLEVTVVAPESCPLERVLGAELGGMLRTLHEQNGVRFALRTTAAAIESGRVELADGSVLDADLVVIGIGVRPTTALAEAAGLEVDRGILVNEYLETSARDIWAAGDAARWSTPPTGELVRVEHWVVAQRMGQTAARNILGRRQRFDPAPFFWTTQYGVTVSYVGHAERWDRVEVHGSVDERDARVEYFLGERRLAVATVGQGQQSLIAEAELEATPGQEGAASRSSPREASEPAAQAGVP